MSDSQPVAEQFNHKIYVQTGEFEAGLRVQLQALLAPADLEYQLGQRILVREICGSEITDRAFSACITHIVPDGTKGLAEGWVLLGLSSTRCGTRANGK